MRRKLTVFLAIIMAVFAAAILSGCSSSVTSGTWYMKDSDDGYINFSKDGTALIYDGTTVYVAEWSENNGVIKLEYDSDTLKLELDANDKLANEDAGVLLKKGKYQKVPDFTRYELCDNTWVQDGVDCELTFYDDDTWDIYDYEESEYIAEGSYEIYNGKLTMTDEEDNEYSPKLSADRRTLTIDKDLVFQIGEVAEDAAVIGEETVAAPTPDDPLDASIAMPGFESLMVYYPSTMKVAASNDRFLQIDAVNDPDNHEVILLDFIEIQGTYDDRLSSSKTARAAFAEIAPKICEIQFPGMLIKTVGTEFVDGGTYYSAINYLWMSGEVFEQAADTPVRGILECRYYGHTGYILAVFTLADEGAIPNYFGIASNIINAISFDDGWTTPKASGGTKWSDPGDYGYYEDGQWYESNDYDPWSDPGDYGYYEDDEWYESDDYDPYSDPGDGDDEWSDPGDTYDDGYVVESDPGDGDDEWSDPGDYGY